MVHIAFSYADDVNILGGSVHTIKKNTEYFVVASKVTGKEVNAYKVKYRIIRSISIPECRMKLQYKD
jgi:hypothetical protein